MQSKLNQSLLRLPITKDLAALVLSQNLDRSIVSLKVYRSISEQTAVLTNEKNGIRTNVFLIETSSV
jgi:hypothetical protein